jgi:hypothetical protein
MPDIIKDYDAKDADCHLAPEAQEAVLLFLCPEGWVGVTLGLDDLVRFRDRISRELSRRAPLDQRH